MANQDHLAVLKQGVQVWNQWRKEHPDVQPDLKGTNLSGAILNSANLRKANLTGTNLSRADLSGADLREANFLGAILRGAKLSNANLHGANLYKIDLAPQNPVGDSGSFALQKDLQKPTHPGEWFSFPIMFRGALDLSERADLRWANLWEADLREAKLMKADLMGAHLQSADLSGADLSGANLSRAILREAKLMKADLSEADLSQTFLSGANLSGANLTRTRFDEAILRRVDMTEAFHGELHLSGTYLSGADLSGADLSRANLSGADLSGANLTGCRVYAVSAWDVQLEQTSQSGLIITPAGEATITVDNLEMAQFIYLLLNHKKLRAVLQAVTERAVLLLGRFGGGGLEVLQAIAAKLRDENYLPIIFDFERPQDRNYTETVLTLAGLARFIIADLSGPSVPQELYATVPHFKIPFVPIIKASSRPFSMVVDLLEYPWVVRPPVTFATTEELLEQMPAKVIAPAEEKHQARQKLLDELFNEA